MIIFSAAISACEKGGQWERALSLLDEMRESGVTPNVFSFNAAISACEKGGQVERALSLLEEMRESGVTPDEISFKTAVSACEKDGVSERARSLLDEMRERGVIHTRSASAEGVSVWWPLGHHTETPSCQTPQPDGSDDLGEEGP